MSAARSRLLGFGVAALFMALLAAIFVLTLRHIVTVQMALLMFVALVGLYVGFGVLIAMYRLVGKLQ